MESYLKASNSSTDDKLGSDVDISGDTIVAGAWGESSDTTTIIHGSDLSATNNDGSYNGAAYVFKRSGTTWSQEAYLKAPNTSNNDYFGDSVAIDSDSIIVGAYQESGTTTAIIHGSDLSATNDIGSKNGAAYVFTRSGTTWSHQAYLKAPNNTGVFKYFGYQVDISGDRAVVSAYGETSGTTDIIQGSDLSATSSAPPVTGAGALYVFSRSGGTWSHEAYLKAPDTPTEFGSNGDNFGQRDVSIDGTTIAVGVEIEDSSTTAIIHGSDLSAANNDGNNNGAAYVFTYQ